MISVQDALGRIVTSFAPLPAETVGLGECLGRVLAEPVVARTTAPPANVAAVDGYAVRADDFVRRLPVRLYIIGEVAAGKTLKGAVHPGEAVRIFTGAPMPSGTNAVIPLEAVKPPDDDGYFMVGEAVPASRNVRAAGIDFKSGDICLAAGKTVTVRDVGLMAAMNVPWLRVRRKPRVAILATGNEVVLPGEHLGPNQITSSNTLSLMALVTACGGVPLNLGVAQDNAESLLAAAAAAEGADLLVTSGGASDSDYDIVHKVLGGRGHPVHNWKVAMQPGRPLLFGKTGNVPLLGLPGNPVSSMVSALVFLRGALKALLGQSTAAEVLPPTAKLGHALPTGDFRQVYLRATLGHDAAGDLTATPFMQQDAAMLTTLAASDCLIVRQPHAPAAAVGDRVEILPLEGGMFNL
ncbi:MAG: gephyrin-like molybdotransferase Glp [Rhodospirillaceae bacterium]